MSLKAAIRELCFGSLFWLCLMLLAKNFTMIACIVMPYSHQLLFPVFSLTSVSGSRQKGEFESRCELHLDFAVLNSHSMIIVNRYH